MDPFEILEIPADSTESEIKSAYRSKAKLYHPDTNPSKEAKEKFLDVQEAYERALRISRGEEEQSEFSPFDIHQGFERFVYRVMEQRIVSLSLEEAYHGTTKNILIHGNSIKITFPAGIKNGHMIKKIAGEIELILICQIKAHPRFTFISELDLQIQERISFIELMLGGKIKVDSLSGTLIVEIKPMTQAGSVLRVPGKGFKSGLSTGDLFIKLEGRIPDKITPQDAAKITALAIS
jgi:curved DNA-binding protein